MACQLQEDLVKKLSDFGLTVNQAKVYLSIVQSGPTCVSKISESTQLHRQDVYKIVPKLEKMGLIIKTIDKPIMIEAIPLEKALNGLVSTEREKANERNSRLESNLKELINEIREKQERQDHTKEEARLIFLTTDAAIKNRVNLSFENARIECDLVMSLKMFTRLMHRFRERFRTPAREGARIRIILEGLNNKDLAKTTLDKIRPKEGDFAAKFIHKSEVIAYYIIDHKEVWISAHAEMRTTAHPKKTETGSPCVVWANDRNMVQFFEECFKATWNDPRAITIYPKKDLQREN